MITILNILILIPISGYFLSLLLPKQNEKLISVSSYLIIGLHMLLAQVFIVMWFINGQQTLDVKDFTLFKSENYEFFIDFTFDLITAVYLFVGSFLVFLVTIYSRYYMHRESGYKRFFNTLLFFYVGYNLVIFSGNLETLFIGWEVLGVSSFLLIAFYRERYLPVKNAVKVFSIYRIGDVGLLLAMWLSHHLWHENITFGKLSEYELVHQHLVNHTWVGVFISIMILISAAAKSAQIPFSSWLPRAMEGPTPSSAIFYGSLSVHIGVFILLRTFPFWEHQLSVRILIGLCGLVSALIATGIARVQSTVKSQIAYSSIAQIGLIFIELSFGLTTLALIHFAGNAFLRTYQLLVSPSVVSYLIREQFYNFIPRERTFEDSWPKRIEYTFYILCLKEWNLDSMLYRYFWNPLKIAGRKLDFPIRYIVLFCLIVLGSGVLLVGFQDALPSNIVHSLPVVFAGIGLIMVLKSFSERRNVKLAWILVLLNHCMIAIAISFNEHVTFDHIALYLGGVLVFGLVGFLGLRRLRILEEQINLDQFHGHSFRHPKISLVFLISCLAITGFPITPTFIGEDLIFSHIHEDQPVLAALTAFSLIVDGLSSIRIYARVFLGPHVKSIFEMAYRSS